MCTLVVNDVTFEVTPKRKNATIAYYTVNIVGYEAVDYKTIEIVGTREFSSMITVLENLALDAIANIDSSEEFSC